MRILLILALTLHPATANVSTPKRVVYSCPRYERLYIRVRGGAEYIKSLGPYKLEGTDILVIGRYAYYPDLQIWETQADDRHYCIAK